VSSIGSGQTQGAQLPDLLQSLFASCRDVLDCAYVSDFVDMEWPILQNAVPRLQTLLS
jgi:hypothetical protein